MDWHALRRRLEEESGERYWRSLDELADTEAFREAVRQEFPAAFVEEGSTLDRRRFLRLMGASLALAGITSCTRQPPEEIVPYVQAPQEVQPAKPLSYATALCPEGYASGVLVTSHMGRPTKVEGNPRHPASLGATDARTQAAILGLYDPDRSQVVTRRGRIRTWSAFVARLGLLLQSEAARDGAGLRVLTGTVTSPTLAGQMEALLERFPRARWHSWEPVHRDAVREGARRAFGEVVETRYRLDRADVVLSLDADFLFRGAAPVRYARDFTSRRELLDGDTGMNRLYVVEPTPTLTGAMADHRLPLRSAEVEPLARALARRLDADAGPGPEWDPGEEHRAWLDGLVEDLRSHRGTSVVLAGETQPAGVHRLAHALNRELGNVGATVEYTDPVEANTESRTESLRELVRDMEQERVEVLVILGGNPVWDAPDDLRFGEALSKVRQSVHLATHQDETSELCHWHIPAADELESWSDARAYDGTASIVQPLIEPLYRGRTAHELLSVLLGERERSSREIVREHWRAEHGEEGFDDFWKQALHEGSVAGTRFPPREVSWRGDDAGSRESEAGEDRGDRDAAGGLDLVIRPGPTVFDGRFANNGWLQELPRPLTKLTWDNAVLIGPRTAEELDVRPGDVVSLHAGEGSIRGPCWVLPGQAGDTVTVQLGYGRRRAGKVGTGVGFNAYPLRTAGAPWLRGGVSLERTGGRASLASTQDHHSMEGRHLVRTAALDEYRSDPSFAKEAGHAPPEELTLYPDRPAHEGHAWGMVIDLNACTGCSACVVACQAENNIPVVGKEEVSRGREMHWLRIDRYYSGQGGDELDDPAVHHQPVLCMHCENAPCEPVCPTGATVHSREGLNEMVYNRCVGTRYCSNNCPYKVRRFNFYQYADWKTETRKMARNPEVTTRSRGVMEKCTYCVQRISAARIEAKKEGRAIRDGEVVTACQAVCPTRAITFGDIGDRESRVARRKSEPREYGLLAELGTRPRTSYLASVRNPRPAEGPP